MILCRNKSDPNRNDGFGKDGYTNCCWIQSCIDKIGKNDYFKERVEFEFFDKKGNKVLLDDNEKPKKKKKKAKVDKYKQY